MSLYTVLHGVKDTCKRTKNSRFSFLWKQSSSRAPPHLDGLNTENCVCEIRQTFTGTVNKQVEYKVGSETKPSYQPYVASAHNRRIQQNFSFQTRPQYQTFKPLTLEVAAHKAHVQKQNNLCF
jgi:hypothetical protein